MPKDELIAESALINKVTTTTDGGIRLTFDLPCDSATSLTVAALMLWKTQNGQVILKMFKKDN